MTTHERAEKMDQDDEQWLLSDIIATLRLRIAKDVKYIQTEYNQGGGGNGYAAVLVPDWQVRQWLDRYEAVRPQVEVSVGRSQALCIGRVSQLGRERLSRIAKEILANVCVPFLIALLLLYVAYLFLIVGS